MIKIAFVCVGNAGRSQLATAFAERERDRRNLGDAVEIVTGGIDPHDHVHKDAVRAQRDEIRDRVMEFFDRLDTVA